MLLALISCGLPWRTASGDYVFLYMVCAEDLTSLDCKSIWEYYCDECEWTDSAVLPNEMMLACIGSSVLLVFWGLLDVTLLTKKFGCWGLIAHPLGALTYLGGLFAWMWLTFDQMQLLHTVSYGFSVSLVNSLVSMWIGCHALHFKRLYRQRRRRRQNPLLEDPSIN